MLNFKRIGIRTTGIEPNPLRWIPIDVQICFHAVEPVGSDAPPFREIPISQRGTASPYFFIIRIFFYPVPRHHKTHIVIDATIWRLAKVISQSTILHAATMHDPPHKPLQYSRKRHLTWFLLILVIPCRKAFRLQSIFVNTIPKRQQIIIVFIVEVPAQINCCGPRQGRPLVKRLPDFSERRKMLISIAWRDANYPLIREYWEFQKSHNKSTQIAPHRGQV